MGAFSFDEVPCRKLMERRKKILSKDAGQNRTEKHVQDSFCLRMFNLLAAFPCIE